MHFSIIVFTWRSGGVPYLVTAHTLKHLIIVGRPGNNMPNIGVIHGTLQQLSLLETLTLELCHPRSLSSRNLLLYLVFIPCGSMRPLSIAQTASNTSHVSDECKTPCFDEIDKKER